jgi:ComF family protein
MSGPALGDARTDRGEDATGGSSLPRQAPASRAVPSWLGDGFALVLDLVFPPRCVVCRRRGAWLCPRCLNAVQPIAEPICSRCGMTRLQGHVCTSSTLRPLTLHGLRAAGRYHGTLREAIHHFKYNGLRALATPLGDILCEAYLRYGLQADLLAPVPLHTSRQAERGFNQAALLAQRLAARNRLPVASAGFLRVRNTHSQVGLNAAQRRANVSGAFAWHGPSLQERHVLVIDDVCTTGATMEACAEALASAGAGSVWGLALAREDAAVPDAHSGDTLG